MRQLFPKTGKRGAIGSAFACAFKTELRCAVVVDLGDPNTSPHPASCLPVASSPQGVDRSGLLDLIASWELLNLKQSSWYSSSTAVAELKVSLVAPPAKQQ